MNALLTDLYQLTMAAGYFQEGRTREIATFELFVRRLPPHRNFLVAAGLPQAVEYLRNLRFTGEEIAYLRTLPVFARVDQGFFDHLAELRFTGDLDAVPEGTPVFPNEPLLRLRAPLIEAQIPETYLLACVGFQSLIAAKAARVAHAAQGRTTVEMGTRRAHSPEAGVLAARAAYLGGCDGTSNVLAGMRYGVPVYGTAAHAWVQSYTREQDAYAALQRLLGSRTVHLIDTYDTLEGARRAAALGAPLWGVRLDSGDLLALSRQVRGILDAAGLHEAKIMATGDLQERRIAELLAANAPIDSFGVGTELATSSDAPALGAVYKLVELEAGGERRYTAKLSQDKATLPGAKQVHRHPDYDVISRAEESAGGEPLLRPVLRGGELVAELPDAATARARCQAAVAALSPELRSLDAAPAPHPVRVSEALQALHASVQRQVRQGASA